MLIREGLKNNKIYIMKRNHFYKEDNYYVGICSDGTKFLFDEIDYPAVSSRVWYRHKGNIETSRIHSNDKNTITLASFIFQREGNKKVLRKDSSVFDYRRSNLFAGNQYILMGDYYKCECFDGRYFYIDKEDYNKVSKISWHIDKNGYVVGKNTDKKLIKIHRLIMLDDLNEPVEIDHIDRDTLNNRKSNLRKVDRSTNCKNRGLGSNNKSGAHGVYFNGTGWCAQINDRGKRRYLGYFNCKEDAVAKRVEAEKMISGFIFNGKPAAEPRTEEGSTTILLKE